MSEPRLQIERFAARLRAAPESPWFVPLAAAHRAAGELEAAQRILCSGLERHPGHVSARVLLAQVQLELQSEDAAELTFARVLELDPENVVALRYRAERARRRGALERAYEIVRLLLEIDPFDREVQADLGLLSAALERRVRAGAIEPADREPRPPLAATPPPPLAPPASPPTAVESPSAAAEAPRGPEAGSKLELPWLHAVPEPSPRPVQPPASALEPPPIDLDRVGRGGSSPRARPASDRGPFAPRAGEPATAHPSEPAPSRAGESATPVDRAPGSDWTWTRSDDRIVVTPGELPPVRGPIRSVEQRVWGTVPSEPPQVPAETHPPLETPRTPPASIPASAADADHAFSTLTLARIYESQGYLEKALAIYDDLHRRFPADAEIASHLTALQRRLAGIAETAAVSRPPPPAPAPSPIASDADAAVTWRLVDPSSVHPDAVTERLRQATSHVRERERGRHHTVIGTPPAPPEVVLPPLAEPGAAPSPPEDVSRGHADFQRFLHYVRSLKP